MNRVVHNITLDLLKSGSQAAVRVKQSETGARRIAIRLVCGSAPYIPDANTSVQFRGIKPDDNSSILYNTATIEDGLILIDLTTQTVAAVGEVKCELSLTDTSSNQMYSPRFSIYVESYLYADSEVESEDEYSNLTTAINNIPYTFIKYAASEPTQDSDMKDTIDDWMGVYIGTSHTAPTTYTSYQWKSTGGSQGPQGEDGTSPSASVAEITGGARITVTDADGTTIADLTNGVSPSASVAPITGGARITVTDGDGTTTADLTNGADGTSPTASVSKSGKVSTLTVTDANGTTTVEINDGADGTGTGDMTKAVYDTDNDGVVDNAAKLENHAASYFATAASVPTKVSDLTNDSGFLTSYTETDPTVPSWAKAASKPTYTASDVGAVPTTRKVNNKALSSDITLSASDVGAAASTHNHDTSYSALSHNHNAAYAGLAHASRHATGGDDAITPSDIGAAAASHNQSASTITAGTLGGSVVANDTASATLTTYQIRNVAADTTALTAGTSALTTGNIYFQYE